MSRRLHVKHGIDRLGALGLLTAASPLMGLVALAILVDDGRPVFFVQERPGHRERPFRCFKFRTMIRDADRFVDARGRPTRSRVTRVGRWLRRTSLDELPQLANIALGHMSFVGPRPTTASMAARFTDEQRRRFRMRPGVTGLAQLAGRNTVRWSRRLELDNAYIDRWSLSADARILLATVPMVVRGEGVVLDRNPEQVDDLQGAS